MHKPGPVQSVERSPGGGGVREKEKVKEDPANPEI